VDTVISAAVIVPGLALKVSVDIMVMLPAVIALVVVNLSPLTSYSTGLPGPPLLSVMLVLGVPVFRAAV
jgi:hypothetical protein